MLCASLRVKVVPVLVGNGSTPTNPQMFLAGTSSVRRSALYSLAVTEEGRRMMIVWNQEGTTSGNQAGS